MSELPLTARELAADMAFREALERYANGNGPSETVAWCALRAIERAMPKQRPLTFAALRRANTERLPGFRNRNGDLAHARSDGSDWSLNDWLTAVAGELGEAANVLKKVRRGDFTLDEARSMLAQEFSDVVIYLDLLAKQAGIDLDAAVVHTFNEKSRQVGSDVMLELANP